ncbi:MAG: hypothetical protein J6L00_04405, partial [Clostridia bacterium]|nr:hypothetical protein [Clostridia bacterium]
NGRPIFQVRSPYEKSHKGVFLRLLWEQKAQWGLPKRQVLREMVLSYYFYVLFCTKMKAVK